MTSVHRFSCTVCRGNFDAAVDLRVVEPEAMATIAIRKANPTDDCKHKVVFAHGRPPMPMFVPDTTPDATQTRFDVTAPCCTATFIVQHPPSTPEADVTFAARQTLAHHRCADASPCERRVVGSL